MLSLGIRCALEQEVVGQSRPVHSVARTLTIALAGLANPASPLGIYLFVGPSGTGKTHMARSTARVLHGDPQRMVVVDCIQLGGRDEWGALSAQIAPCFRYQSQGEGDSKLSMGPLSVLLVEHLEWARPELVQALVTAIETGSIMLPDGKCGSLASTLVLMTSNLCAREIFDAGRSEIGFSASTEIEETEKATIYRLVLTAAEKQWGTDLLGHLDDLLVFHRLREKHLPFILNRLVLQLNSRLAARHLSCTVDPDAAGFLLSRGALYLRHGAWILVRVFRRFVLFPIADLVHSGRLAPGSRIHVTKDGDDRLRFDVQAADPGVKQVIAGLERPYEVPVAWNEDVPLVGP